MADIFDTLKKHTDRVNNSTSKSKKVKREKTRPWHDYTVTTSNTQLNEQNTVLNSSSLGTTINIDPPAKIEPEHPTEAKQIHKQSVNNAETNVYVNEDVYVNRTETKTKKSQDIIELSPKSGNNAETNVYVNEDVYVNRTETESGLDYLASGLIIKSEVGSNENTETIVYVNSTETIRKQSVNHAETILKQKGNDTETIRKLHENNSTSNTITSTETERKQATPAELVYSLPRSEEKILKFIVELCLNSASLVTPKLTYRLISNATQITEKSCKTLIGRLKNKNIMRLESYTKGPGSYSVFSISQEVYNSFLYISGKSVLFDMRKQSVNSTETQSPLNTDTTPSSKLVSNLINTNNTKESLIYDFGVKDCDLTNSIHIGIGEKAVGDALRNLTKKLKLNSEIPPVTKHDFQDFINKFVEYAQSKHGNGMKNKVAMFISEFDKFQLTGSCSTTEWHNDRDFEHYEQFVKQQEAETKRRQEFIEKALDYKFEEWVSKMTEEDLLELIPESKYSKFGGPGYQLELKNYFRKNIWEDVRKEIKA